MIGPKDGKLAHSRFRCKSYGCAICGPRKLRRVRKAIVKLAATNGLTRFVTLTLGRRGTAGRTTKEQAQYLKECWRKMRVSLQRKHKRSLAFISVVELHKSGVPHLHILIESFLPQAWLSVAWQKVGGGRVVDIRKVEIKRVAAYLSQYFTKEKQLEGFPAGVRRFSTSRGLSLFPRSDGKSGWGIARITIDLFYSTAIGIQAESERFETDAEGARELVFCPSETYSDILTPLCCGA